jgi:ABC-type glycerol-3-phosphate transport system substrate-binding protein
LQNVNSYYVKDAEKAFVEGKAAMLLGASFMYSEVEKYMQDGVVYKMMNMPTIANAQQKADGTAMNMNYYTSEDFMIVPKNATNKDLAKEFLAFLCNEEQLMNFTKSTGVVRPFDYNAYELDANYAWTDFQKSTFNIYYNADDFVIKYPLTATTVSPIYLYEEVSIFMGIELSTVFGEFRSTPVDQAADRIVSRVYTALKKSFDEWTEYYGLEA